MIGVSKIPLAALAKNMRLRGKAPIEQIDEDSHLGSMDIKITMEEIEEKAPEPEDANGPSAPPEEKKVVTVSYHEHELHYSGIPNNGWICNRGQDGNCASGMTDFY